MSYRTAASLLYGYVIARQIICPVSFHLISFGGFRSFTDPLFTPARLGGNLKQNQEEFNLETSWSALKGKLGWNF